MEIFGMQFGWGGIVLFLLLAALLGVILAKRERIAKWFASMREFFGEVSHEMTKVTWPSREEVVNNVVLVLIVVVALTVVLMAFDRLFSQIVGLLFVSGPPA